MCLTFSTFLSHPLSTYFFLTYTSITGIYTLSLHDALPILAQRTGKGASAHVLQAACQAGGILKDRSLTFGISGRSEEHTSELQSRFDLVCRLLLEKKKI